MRTAMLCLAAAITGAALATAFAWLSNEPTAQPIPEVQPPAEEAPVEVPTKAKGRHDDQSFERVPGIPPPPWLDEED